MRVGNQVAGNQRFYVDELAELFVADVVYLYCMWNVFWFCGCMLVEYTHTRTHYCCPGLLNDTNHSASYFDDKRLACEVLV